MSTTSKSMMFVFVYIECLSEGVKLPIDRPTNNTTQAEIRDRLELDWNVDLNLLLYTSLDLDLDICLA